MIRILGIKRIATIALLLGLNICIAAGVYLYLMPEKVKKQRELNTLKGQISTVQSDISRMQVEFDQLSEQQAQFERLRERGFFSTQGRRDAERILEKIQKESGVISAVANIEAGTVADDPEAQKAEHKLLVSPINIVITAVDDVDIYRYLYLVDKFFPGHIAIQKITLERKGNLSNEIIRGIASGTNPPLVSAEIQVLWRTMIPQKDVIGAPVGGQL